MCRGCDVDSGPGRGEIWARATPDERAFQRNAQASVLKGILGAYGITVRELPAGDTYLLSNRTGSSVVVAGIRHVWAEGASLVGRSIDVLSEPFLVSLEEHK